MIHDGEPVPADECAVAFAQRESETKPECSRERSEASSGTAAFFHFLPNVTKDNYFTTPMNILNWSLATYDEEWVAKHAHSDKPVAIYTVGDDRLRRRPNSLNGSRAP